LLTQANQLDFLLSKASEYSNFIANDLKELQESMTETAKKKLKAAEKKSKKRKSKGEVSASKKKKKIESEEALKTAQDKHAKHRTGSKPIFSQPENLAEGCLLKDYQLVGVRWLASLFENGVSGILADGKK
jgi:ATP-dependent DNA helicase